MRKKSRYTRRKSERSFSVREAGFLRSSGKDGSVCTFVAYLEIGDRAGWLAELSELRA